ncbi:uncharacterized protein VICG_01195 [Vittaforma corneae ATCC 50505]|uniref:Uncharacterized protein n=1 Tax=Vittaforma corneae (strain ATCC 50505) TaxID=993615 RepID=L2GLS6_VITCO|nr:uncharacterized protein VICG_01195 [Vittaforma corneae ATCC 50505]ELA41843.1 hypothetical protein VICG_01195 [Vittaforma corneae ATCC 50505]
MAHAYDAITTFLDNPIRIFSSNSNHVFLAKDLSNNSLVHTSKFAIVKKIYSSFTISKNKNEYQIKSGTEYVCQKDNEVGICDKEDYWNIKPQVVGYRISKKGDKCLTLETGSRVTFVPCSVEKDQTFDFKLAEEDEKCDEAESSGNIKSKANPAPQKVLVDLDFERLLNNNTIRDIIETSVRNANRNSLNVVEVNNKENIPCSDDHHNEHNEYVDHHQYRGHIWDESTTRSDFEAAPHSTGFIFV